jgi:hypothetical protein
MLVTLIATRMAGVMYDYFVKTAGPSPSLRFGRDDKGRVGQFSEDLRLGWMELRAASPRRLRIPPLRYVSVGIA